METPRPALPGREIASILRDDRKQNTYKMALVRALNDVVTGFPGLAGDGLPVAVPLRMLGARWVAYFWPFASTVAPVWQGARATRGGAPRLDVGFRPSLERLRAEWTAAFGADPLPSDGFFLVDTMRVPRRRALLPAPLVGFFNATVRQCARLLGQNPVRYAGPGEYGIFPPPARLDALGPCTPVPGTTPDDPCVLVRPRLWADFDALSLWVEALCVHEWSLFVEAFNPGTVSRGDAFTLLTARPDSRLSLSWERNQIDVLRLEGHAFTCPWTGRLLATPGAYDLDHILPLAAYPVNDLWNLVPADPKANNAKRDRLPTPDRLDAARPRLAHAYGRYLLGPALRPVLAESARLRFGGLPDPDAPAFPDALAAEACRFVEHVAAARNVPRY